MAPGERRYLELQHLQALVGELEERQRGLHHVQRVDHVGGHVGRAQVAGGHRAELQEGVQNTRQDLEPRKNPPSGRPFLPLCS